MAHLFPILGLVVWTWLLYKLHDYLAYDLRLSGGKPVFICLTLFFAALFFVGWLNGVPIFGEGELCYGGGNNSTC